MASTIPTDMLLMSVGKSSGSKMFITDIVPRVSLADGIRAMMRGSQSIIVFSNGLPSAASFNLLHAATARECEEYQNMC